MKLASLYTFLFLMAVCISYGQSSQDSSGAQNDIMPKIPLTLKSLNNYPDILKLRSSQSFSLPEYYSLQSNALESNLNLNMKKINSQLLQDFRRQMAWQKKRDLGVLGQYLGYAMSAAAAGLAISHIVKYKEKAFIGK